MSKGILTRPDEKDLEYTAYYLSIYPNHLYNIDILGLRLLKQYIDKTLPKINKSKAKSNIELKSILEKLKQVVNDRLYEQQYKLSSSEGFKKKNSQRGHEMFLSNFFYNHARYNGLIRILVENNITTPDCKFLDRKKGYKTYLVVLIKQLYIKGWLRFEPSNYEIQRIASNTFGIKIGIDTIKRAKGNQYTISYLRRMNGR